MAIGTLIFTDTETIAIQAATGLTGTDYQPLQSNQTVKKIVAVGTAAANAAAGGSDEAASFLITLSASASVSTDLTSITDIMQTASVTLARIKALIIRLLSATDDATNGTAASGITIDGTVTNGLLSATGSGWLTNSTSKFDVPNGGKISFGTPAAAGVVVNSGSKIVKITNLDGALTAKAQLTCAGGST